MYIQCYFLVKKVLMNFLVPPSSTPRVILFALSASQYKRILRIQGLFQNETFPY